MRYMPAPWLEPSFWSTEIAWFDDAMTHPAGLSIAITEAFYQKPAKERAEMLKNLQEAMLRFLDTVKRSAE